MPSFRDATTTTAPAEEIWKLLYDPARFPEWWAGYATVEAQDDGRYTMYPDGYPDFPIAQLLDSQRDAQRVIVSCLVSDIRFDWRLEPDGEGTRITVDVEIPDAEAARLETQLDVIHDSLLRLAALGVQGT